MPWANFSKICVYRGWSHGTRAQDKPHPSNKGPPVSSVMVRQRGPNWDKHIVFEYQGTVELSEDAYRRPW